MKEIEYIKKEFAKEFIEAMSSRSIDKCANVILVYDEYKALRGDDEKISKEEYLKAISTQCNNFFKKYDDFLDSKRLLEDKIENIELYDVGEIIDNKAIEFIPMDSLTISLAQRIFDNGDKGSIGFEIDHLFIINSKIKINNFLFTKVYESFDTISKNVLPLQKIGFEALSKNKYLEIMKKEKFDYTQELISSDNEWLIYKGNLILEPENFKLFQYRNIMVFGNLTVNGLLDTDDMLSLIVIGNINANNALILGSINLYISGTIYFNDALIIETDESIIDINIVEGTFVYVDDIDLLTIKILKEKVNIFYENSFEQSFGDYQTLLKDSCLEFDEDYEQTYILTDELSKLIRNNQKIFRDKDDKATKQIKSNFLTKFMMFFK